MVQASRRQRQCGRGSDPVSLRRGLRRLPLAAGGAASPHATLGAWASGGFRIHSGTAGTQCPRRGVNGAVIAAVIASSDNCQRLPAGYVLPNRRNRPGTALTAAMIDEDEIRADATFTLQREGDVFA